MSGANHNTYSYPLWSLATRAQNVPRVEQRTSNNSNNHSVPVQDLMVLYRILPDDYNLRFFHDILAVIRNSISLYYIIAHRLNNATVRDSI